MRKLSSILMFFYNSSKIFCYLHFLY